MEVTVNLITTALAPGATVLELISQHTGREIMPSGQAADGGRLGLAVARNGEVVARSQWAAVALQEADHIDIVTAVQGG
ncbi:sulfur carrier protein [Psychromicrobium silvestre]|uniref:Sulfur carrier protein n=1 Tax=Psychromicrobium silvestre TaxID=1645614 RepID=A0A7Y9S5R1_9MICC|nr:sulfur carrier protein ThiS [Psychromicrobium silvestre]NYE95043.1 sulfur carrier protein [Psychromicrobium silvestre]